MKRCWRLAVILAVSSAPGCERTPGTDASGGSRPEREARSTRGATDAAGSPAAAGSASADSITLPLYFIRDEQPVAVTRTVPDSPDTLAAALAALLAGPARAEQEAGLTSWFSSATAGALRSARVVDGLAIVDFRDFSSRIPGASSSLGSTLLLASLNATVLANSEADSVEYRFEGSCEAFGEFVQRGCIRYYR